MNKYDLAILIPAREEEFIGDTVINCLQNIRGKTEIIVWLDGEWPLGASIPDHPSVTVVYSPVSIGQRAGTNQACRLTKAKYVMKADAHCAFSEGFDVELVNSMEGHDDWTMIPALYNLHAFNWRCKKCGNLWYQGPQPIRCMKNTSAGHVAEEINYDCDGADFEKVMVWQPRLGTRNECYRFDTTLHFQYHGVRKHWGNNDNEDIIETMSIQGSGFCLTRQKYWELNICDEGHGSWGQQGVEVACKTWLSGGRVVTNKKCWYSHMFRTVGGFAFPYKISSAEQEAARQYSRDIWFNNKWPLQIYPLLWLIDKFNPLPDWHESTKPQDRAAYERVKKAAEEFYKTHESYKKVLDEVEERVSQVETPVRELTRGLIFYTDNQLSLKYAKRVQKQLRDIADQKNLQIVSASLKPMDHFGKNVHLPLERGMDTYFQQIIKGLETLDTDIVYFCEHDVIYSPTHFDFIPDRQDMFYYNQNFWRIRPEVDDLAVHWDANQVSGLVCYRQYALDWYKKKYEEIKKNGFDRSYEPGGRDQNQYQTFKSKTPNIDIRHKGTLTKDKWSPNDFRDKSTCINWQEATIHSIPGWSASQIVFD